MNMLKQQDTHSRRAASYTAFVLAVFISILFLLKWKLPTFEKEVNDAGVDVEVNWPPDPPTPFQDGGGGGGQDLKTMKSISAVQNRKFLAPLQKIKTLKR